MGATKAEMPSRHREYTRVRGPTDVRNAFSRNKDREIPPKHRLKALRMLTERQGPVRLGEFHEAGVDYAAIRNMAREGIILHPAMGVFAPTMEYDPFQFAMAVLQVHGADFFACLETAARFHGLVPIDDNLLWIVLPNHRETLRDVCGYEPVPVRWNSMRLPTRPPDWASEDKERIGWTRDMADAEARDLIFGIERHIIYGAQIRMTNPARTVCDLLQHRNRRLGREGLEGLHISDETAFSAVSTFAIRHDLSEAIQFAQRHGYSSDVIDILVSGQVMAMSYPNRM